MPDDPTLEEIMKESEPRSEPALRDPELELLLIEEEQIEVRQQLGELRGTMKALEHKRNRLAEQHAVLLAAVGILKMRERNRE